MSTSPQRTSRPPSPAPPSSTYRLQIQAGFDFDDAAQQCAYLAQLGVTHVYLSPILQAVPGSEHGYDVIDHSQLSSEAGGREAFDRLAMAAQGHGLQLIADVVPNHMAVPTPVRLNAPLWSVLKQGPASAFAGWFDIDWSPGQLLMPVLGDPIGTVLNDGLLTVDATGDEPVLRYHEHEFPLRDGTAGLPLPELLAQQHYRLAWWRIGGDELNYRRFFDVTTLAAIRVEDPGVFAASHALLGELIAGGQLTGLRIDHPDGLADPEGYLRDLRDLTGGTWVVVEKILEGEERLPETWACAGTTGYDALNVIGGLLVDPAARLPLTRLALGSGELTEAAIAADLESATRTAKHLVADEVLTAELNRLTDLLVQICAGDLQLRDHTRRVLRNALSELLAQFDRYRAYAVPGEPVPAESAAVAAAAADRARDHLGTVQERAALDAIAGLALDTLSGQPLRDEFVVRFQQTCGPVMAKGIEDTLFYRWIPLLALNEVGADPHRFGYSPAEFHRFAATRLRDWPDAMTTLSTHDTKRSEDARARLYALSQVPQDWAAATTRWASAARGAGLPEVARSTELLLWQTLIAVWDDGPPDAGRVLAYLQKALREAKEFTSWTTPDETYEEHTQELARGVLADPGLMAAIGAFIGDLAPADRANLLGQKLIQLTMPGVPDVYQGCEITDRSLVDPDNRRPVDYARRSKLLAGLAPAVPPAAPSSPDVPSARPGEGAGRDHLDAEKLLVTATALRLRRDHADWFGAGSAYTPLTASTDQVVAFGRGTGDRTEVITIATRLAARLAASGGWGTHTIDLATGSWTDLLTGRRIEGGVQELGAILDHLPVALLVRS